ncbi:MAG: RsmE family RNA methyltransferase, partial [Pseudomonadota bacterium]
MRVVRVYCDTDLAVTERFTLPKEQSHHVSTVLKMRPGEPVEVFNGQGGAYAGVVLSTGKSTVVSLTTALPDAPCHHASATLAIALLRGEKMDWVIQKATELGVTAIQPIVTDRTIATVPKDRLAQRQAHWQQIAISACEQSGRTRLPGIALPLKLSDYL